MQDYCNGLPIFKGQSKGYAALQSSGTKFAVADERKATALLCANSNRKSRNLGRRIRSFHSLAHLYLENVSFAIVGIITVACLSTFQYARGLVCCSICETQIASGAFGAGRRMDVVVDCVPDTHLLNMWRSRRDVTTTPGTMTSLVNGSLSDGCDVPTRRQLTTQQIEGRCRCFPQPNACPFNPRVGSGREMRI